MRSVFPLTIDDFVEKFRGIYGHIDDRRREESLWLQVVEEGSNIAEAVREIKYENALSSLADLFVWLCGFIGKCNHEKASACHFDEPFSFILWLKYPDKCPRCGGTPCRCFDKWKELLQREQKQKERAYETAEKEALLRSRSRPTLLDDLELQFEQIFTSNITISDIKEIAFHLVEEIGEVSEQIRELVAIKNGSLLAGRGGSARDKARAIRELRRELADVFSWMISLLVKIKYLSIGSIPSVKILAKLEANDSLQQVKFPRDSRPLLRHLVLSHYSRKTQMVCRTCHLPKCNLRKHQTIY